MSDIVCWEDDWKNRPKELEVSELKNEINKLKGEERVAQKEIEKRPPKAEVQSHSGVKRLSGWEKHKTRLRSSDAVERKIIEAKAHGVSQKYLRFLGRLKRYWEIREQGK